MGKWLQTRKTIALIVMVTGLVAGCANASDNGAGSPQDGVSHVPEPSSSRTSTLPTKTITTGHPAPSPSTRPPPPTSATATSATAISTTPNSTPPSSSSPTAPRGGLHVTRLALLPGVADAVAATPEAVYAEWAVVHQGQPRLWRIARYDVAQQRVTATSEQLKGAGPIAIAGGALWVATDPGGNQPALVKLDEATLHVTDLVRIPTSIVGGGLVATDAGLWTGGVGKLYLVDPTNDRILRSMAVPAAAGQLAVDRSAGVLYDVTHRPGEATAVALEERDASTGRLISRSTAIENFLAINGLAVVPGNVWVAYASGMMGSADRFTRNGLVQHRPPGEGTLEGTNGMDVFATPGILWNENPGGSLSCLDPKNGVTRDEVEQPLQLGAVAGSHGRVYEVIGNRLERIVPGLACRQ